VCWLGFPDEGHAALAYASRRGGEHRISMAALGVASSGEFCLREDRDVHIEIVHRSQCHQEARFSRRDHIVRRQGDLCIARVVCGMLFDAALLSSLLVVVAMRRSVR